MELVRGIKITEYCDQNRLSAEERLKLFMQLCHALQHAHQKGIIHRDIKPSNVLVTVNDGVPVPKVIDFGIAKATEQRLTDKTLFTAFEQFIGTPAYMSPEQAVMTSLDIDTRTDIYSLGVLLYELLTGQTPFNAKDLLASGLDALRKTIREQEPERPSTRLRTMVHAELAETASHYRTEAPRLIHLLRGDLDWIVMKALEKDRTRRYETANGLALDIERYLTSEPVLARPPSTLYRCQKLIRRNKAAFAAIGTGVAALIVGLALSLYLFFQERQALHRAIAAEKEAKKTAQLESQLRVASERSKDIGMAAFLLTQGKYDEAEKALSKVPLSDLPHIITNYPATAAIFNAVAEKHARHGQWLQAITNYSPVADSFPFDRMVFRQLAPLLAQVGEADRYRHYCELILKHYAGNAEAVVTTTVGKNCLLLPLPRADVEIARDMAESALANKPANDAVPELLFTRGLADYRLSDYSKSAEGLQRAEAADGTRYHNMESLLALAMAQFQIKEVDAARKTLAQGADYAARKLPKPGSDEFSDHWNEALSVYVLLHEAKTLIGEPVAVGERASSSQP
jgi:tetratricopeptide (TPR) repeat protein